MYLYWTLLVLFFCVVLYSEGQSVNQDRAAVANSGNKLSAIPDQNVHSTPTSGQVTLENQKMGNGTSSVSGLEVLNSLLEHDEIQEESRATDHVSHPFPQLPFSAYSPRPNYNALHPASYHHPAPPSPSYGPTGSSYGLPSAPGYSQQMPSYGHQPPTYGSSAPSYGSSAPSYGPQASSYSPPVSNYGPPTSNYGPQSPNYGNQYRKPTVDISLVKPLPTKIASKSSGLGGLVMSLLTGGASGGLQMDGIKDLIINGVLKPLLVAKGGLKSFISKLIVPLLALLLINIEILVVVWWLWEDCPKQPLMYPPPPPPPTPTPSYNYPTPYSYPKAAYDMMYK